MAASPSTSDGATSDGLATGGTAMDDRLSFRVGDEPLAVALGVVREVVRLPPLSRVPLAPEALLGLANIHGAAVPVLSVSALLGGPAGAPNRLIVVEQGETLGLAVDEVSRLSAGQVAGGRLLDPAELVARCLPGRASPARPGRAEAASRPDALAAPDAAPVALVVFAVAGQEFALPAHDVRAILPLPAQVGVVPDVDEAVLGTTVFGEAILPVLSLPVLLGLGALTTRERPRVLVVRLGAVDVGLAVDRVEGLVPVPEAQIDPLPQALRRGQGEARIQAICRLDRGQRLIALLAPDQLLREDITARILAEGEATLVDESKATEDGQASEGYGQLLIFTIAGEDFAIPVIVVEEVAMLPARLTPLPRAPAFVRGVMNLKGQAIPVIDQARRFGLSAPEGPRRRVIVVRVGAMLAGFVVDAITQVVRIDPAHLRPAPDLGDADTRVFDRVATLGEPPRLVLVVGPQALLESAEQDLLRALARKGGKASRAAS